MVCPNCGEDRNKLPEYGGCECGDFYVGADTESREG